MILSTESTICRAVAIVCVVLRVVATLPYFTHLGNFVGNDFVCNRLTVGLTVVSLWGGGGRIVFMRFLNSNYSIYI